MIEDELDLKLDEHLHIVFPDIAILVEIDQVIDLVDEGCFYISEDSLNASGLLSDLLLKGGPVGLKEEGVDDWFVHLHQQKQQDIELAIDIGLRDPVIHPVAIDPLDE